MQRITFVIYKKCFYLFNKSNCLLARSSSEAEFSLYFQNETFYHDSCQTQIDAVYNDIVLLNSSGEVVLLTSLHSIRSTIQETKEIVFKITYFSDSIWNVIYRAVNISLGGSHKDDLPHMKIPFVLPGVDLDQKIEVVSHSKAACAGLYSEFTVDHQAAEQIARVSFIPKDGLNGGCEYLQIDYLSEITTLMSILSTTPYNGLIESANDMVATEVAETRGEPDSSSKIPSKALPLLLVLPLVLLPMLIAVMLYVYYRKRKRNAKEGENYCGEDERAVNTEDSEQGSRNELQEPDDEQEALNEQVARVNDRGPKVVVMRDRGHEPGKLYP